MINATIKLDDNLLNCDYLVKEVLKSALTDYIEVASLLLRRTEGIVPAEHSMRKKERLHTAKLLLKTIDTVRSEAH